MSQNWKNLLQEHIQSKHEVLPIYDCKVISEGTNLSFICIVTALGKSATGALRKTKLDAEQNAAKRMCYRLGLVGFQEAQNSSEGGQWSPLEVGPVEALKCGLYDQVAVENLVKKIVDRVDEAMKVRFKNTDDSLKSNLGKILDVTDALVRVGAIKPSSHMFTPAAEVFPRRQIFVRVPDGSTKTVDVSDITTVGELRIHVSSLCKIPPNFLSLQFRGKVLTDDENMSSSGVLAGDFINVLTRLPGGMPSEKKKKEKKEVKKIMKAGAELAGVLPSGPSPSVKKKAMKIKKKAANAVKSVEKRMTAPEGGVGANIQRLIQQSAGPRLAVAPSVSKFIMSVVTPGLDTPERLGEAFDDSPTAVTAFKGQENGSFTTLAAVPSGLLGLPELGATAILKFRNPVRNVVQYVDAPGNVNYDWVLANNSVETNTLPATTGAMLLTDSEQPIDIRYIRFRDGLPIHGPLLGVGTHPSKPALRFTWYNGFHDADTDYTNWFLTLTAPPAVNGASGINDFPSYVYAGFKYEVYGYRLNEVEVSNAFVVDTSSVVLPGATNNIDLSLDEDGNHLKPGYYAYTIKLAAVYSALADESTPSPARKSSSSAPAPSVPTPITPFGPLPVWLAVADTACYTTGGMWAHKMLPDFESNISSLDNVRVVGSSVMLSQRGATVTSQGTIAQIQLLKLTNWAFQIGLSYADIAKLKDSDTGRSTKTGSYAFIKPTDMKDFSFAKTWQTEDGVIKYINYPVLSETGYVLVYCVTNQPSTGGGLTNPPPEMIITTWSSIEFATLNQIFDTRVGTIDPALVTAAFMRIKKMKQYHNNDNHIRDLFRKALGWGEKVMEYAPKVMEGAKYLGSMF